MSYSAFDLDIENYNITDLENFIQLDNKSGPGSNSGYGVIDIEEKVNIIRNNFMEKITNREFLNKILIFLDESKRILIQNLKTNHIIAVNGSQYVIDKSTENSISSVTNFIQPMNTFPTETAPGILNRLRRRTNFVSLAMNTFFRDSYSGSSTDCFFVLSYPLKHVVSMRLLSIEIPEGIYLLSNVNLTNRFYITEHNTGCGGLIVVPEGCYDAQLLASTIQQCIKFQIGTYDRFIVTIDPINNRTRISNDTNKFNMYFVTEQTNTYVNRNLGWILGFRNPDYKDSMCYLSEGLFNGVPLDYMYFVVNDFNLSRSSNLIAVFNDSFIDKNILAKIPYSNNNFQILFDGKNDVISPIRQYFGPIDLRKIGLQLLDKYGQTINLNNMDFSFTLEIELAYDI